MKSCQGRGTLSTKLAIAAISLLVVCYTVANAMEREQHQCSAADTSPQCGQGIWTVANKLTTTEVGTHEQQKDGSTWQLQYSIKSPDGAKKPISPWHDIPLYGV